MSIPSAKESDDGNPTKDVANEDLQWSGQGELLLLSTHSADDRKDFFGFISQDTYI